MICISISICLVFASSSMATAFLSSADLISCNSSASASLDFPSSFNFRLHFEDLLIGWMPRTSEEPTSTVVSVSGLDDEVDAPASNTFVLLKEPSSRKILT
uniref:Secreted protein n=1 Tax=Opuntia streptacantha TaxID=393608 RepID=A0A7C9E3F9_OPUST